LARFPWRREKYLEHLPTVAVLADGSRANEVSIGRTEEASQSSARAPETDR